MKLIKTLILIGLLSSFNFGQEVARINGGRLGVGTLNESIISTDKFVAKGVFDTLGFESRWYQVCHPVIGQSCNGGGVFKLPWKTRIGQNIGTVLPFRAGDFTINGKTYKNAFYSGNLYFADEILSKKLYVPIPKQFNLRRKGRRSLFHEFSIFSDDFRVCQVSMLQGPCPADKELFYGKIRGEGVVRIRLRYNNLNPEPQDKLYSRLVRVSFDYVFHSEE